MSKILSLVAVAALVAGCAGNSTQPVADEAVAQDDAKQEVRCKYVRTTTSRLGQKVCKKVDSD